MRGGRDYSLEQEWISRDDDSEVPRRIAQWKCGSFGSAVERFAQDDHLCSAGGVQRIKNPPTAVEPRGSLPLPVSLLPIRLLAWGFPWLLAGVSSEEDRSGRLPVLLYLPSADLTQHPVSVGCPRNRNLRANLAPIIERVGDSIVHYGIEAGVLLDEDVGEGAILAEQDGLQAD